MEAIKQELEQTYELEGAYGSGADGAQGGASSPSAKSTASSEEE
jgi:hypothetical protein